MNSLAYLTSSLLSISINCFSSPSKRFDQTNSHHQPCQNSKTRPLTQPTFSCRFNSTNRSIGESTTDKNVRISDYNDCSKVKIGWLCSGRLPYYMAHHLAFSGFETHFFSRTPTMKGVWRRLGSHIHETPSSLVSNSDIIFVYLQGGHSPLSLFCEDKSPNSFLNGCQAGKVVVNFTPLLPSDVSWCYDKMIQKGVHVFDCPIRGDYAEAVNKTVPMLLSSCPGLVEVQGSSPGLSCSSIQGLLERMGKVFVLGFFPSIIPTPSPFSFSLISILIISQRDSVKVKSLGC
eukprot:TRINITY_DN1777_c0_g1_i2.p1 TRINITY_DN1777_c0_g1~~TRINITY_DN1777_c0_g1_i2.p1  ORF type:complete len:289 (-),score=42.57 TRINITY_DN1777_c0_g1_i2:549-1415(-)